VSLSLSPLARADELQDIGKLLNQGHASQALERVNAYLAEHPKSPQARFLKGLVLTDLRQTNEAVQVFQGLTEEYPDLPEPYNNLAVLYANLGQYDKARDALEQAIRTHPSYATAHENLGDIYAKLASRAYDQAYQLDRSNSAAQAKLALIKEIFSESRVAGKPEERRQVVAKGEAPKPTAAPKAEPAPKATDAPTAKPETTGKPEAPAKVEAPAKAPAAEAPAAKAAESPSAKAAAPATDDIVQAVKGWAEAWSAKNLQAYFEHYSSEFRPTGGMSRKKWEKTRTERIGKPGQIEVSVSDTKVSTKGDDHATVSFKQHYKSNGMNSSERKTLVLRKQEGRWLIVEERLGG
jgi:tetratricopeptide (TPR) repeat protein